MDIKIINPHARWSFDENFELGEAFTRSTEYLSLKKVPFSEKAKIKFGTSPIVRPRLLSDEELLKKEIEKEKRNHDIREMILLVCGDEKNDTLNQFDGYQKVKK